MLSGRYLATDSKPTSHIDNIYYLFIYFCIYSIHFDNLCDKHCYWL